MPWADDIVPEITTSWEMAMKEAAMFDNIVSEFARMIRESGLSANQMARELNVHPNTVFYWRGGGLPSFESAYLLLHKLDIPLDRFFTSKATELLLKDLNAALANYPELSNLHERVKAVMERLGIS